jgi:hypothetical protein
MLRVARYNSATAAFVVKLRGLKVYGVTAAVGDFTENGAAAFESAALPRCQCGKLQTPNAERVLVQ